MTTVSTANESPAPGHTSEPDCKCVICRVQRPFGLPDRIVRAAINRELVIFAGAGTSTENPLTLPTTLYSTIVGELGYGHDDDLPAFPQAMTEYEDRHGRPALLQKAKERLDYIDAFDDLRFMATRFHRELSTLFMIDTIVTTNWDTYFETKCGATPIVTEDDYAFWNLPGRKVFKVHGSMNNVGSIIATTGDYERCYAQLREGVIGSTLKHMLATKTTVFLGYSFRDDDFNQIYELVRDQLGPMLPRPVVVTLDDSFDLAEYPGAEVVITDATYFLSELKRAIVSESQCQLPDDRLDGVFDLAMLARREHIRLYDRLDSYDEPLVIYAGAYQDGLSDGFGRIVRLANSGEYSHRCEVRSTISTYARWRKEKLRQRKYQDVAYIDGYIWAMYTLLADDEEREEMPLYYVFGDDTVIRDVDTFISVISAGRDLHKTAYDQAYKISREFGPGIVVHHRATLY